MRRPQRVLDMHVHLFNARYLPLAGIIADLLGSRPPGLLATSLARLLWSLTGSSYVDEARLAAFAKKGVDPDAAAIEAIGRVVEAELAVATGLVAPVATGGGADDGVDHPALLDALADLQRVDFDAEGVPPLDDEPEPAHPHGLAGEIAISSAGRHVRWVLRRVSRAFEPDLWEEGVRYVEFFLTMLSSERAMAARLFDGYGGGMPPLEVVHFMMDMQNAYPGRTPPRYPFHPTQVDRMARLAAGSGGRIAGFAAFDPRNHDWQARCDHARQRGMIGFKFYPAMGYRPHCDGDPQVAARIDAFLGYCLARDVPVFAHCTPEGFQTRERLGYYADPEHWRAALQSRPGLRLCLGHGGGGNVRRTPNADSRGWGARNASEWNDAGNYASRVVALCREYPNVYCELGYLLEMFEDDGRGRVMDCLQLAMEGEGEHPFLQKVIYGSDWHMPSMGDRTREYYESFLRVFADPRFSQGVDDFFWRNGYRFLKRAI